LKTIDFWLDPVSPFAWLAFERLPEALAGTHYAVRYRPILFAGLLKHWGNVGPAEIEPKRAWTFRHVHWIAAQHGIALQTPAQHPFNPLPLLRLLWAAGPNRRTCEAVLRHVWQGGGADALEPARLAALTEALAPAEDPAGEAVKARLRAEGEAAIADGVFGVPSFGVDGRVFWGLDALPMLRAQLEGGDTWLGGLGWAAEGAPRAGVKRG
jgi:2-hydroxychromene-2-carboxylate isomerase